MDPAMLGDKIEQKLPELRAHAESMMRDLCVVEQRTGRVMDPVTLEMTDSWEAVYEGKCRVQRPGASVGGTEPVVGEQEFGVQVVHFQLPLSATGIKRDHRARVTALGSLSDPDLAGLVATVKANLTKTHPTKRTLVCEEVTP